jgi:hypothetical protein
VHALPQLPQLATSLVVSTQAPLHTVVRGGTLHVKLHVDPLHTGVAPAGAVHAFPQLPQLATSLVVSTQVFVAAQYVGLGLPHGPGPCAGRPSISNAGR